MSINLNASPHGNKVDHKGVILGYLTEPGRLYRALFLAEKALSFKWAFTSGLQLGAAGRSRHNT